MKPAGSPISRLCADLIERPFMEEIIITVKARAKAKVRELTVGPDGIYKIKTTQAPEKNKANEDIIAILAEHFGVSKSQVDILSGQTSNQKKFKISK
jgi:uncharacterized protein